VQHIAAPFRLGYAAGVLTELFIPLSALLLAGTSAWLTYRRSPAELTRALARKLDEDDAERRKYRAEIQEQLDLMRREIKSVADEAEDLLDRARADRARANGRRGGRPPTAEAAEPALTPDDYIRHLERGGRPIPALESRLVP